MDPDFGVPMILPKGIVRNTNEIYAALAAFSVVPPEVLWACWHVYTNTSRTLSDPTARRLENFWWHVLGSDRRYLSGKALAKLYEGISNGPTFVPLKGPANRYEGPPIPRFSQHELDRLVAASQPKPRQAQAKAGNPPKSARRLKTAAKGPSSSSSSSSSTKPAPLHPILKNARGPSTSGPRPTARFVSPPESGEESNKDDGTSLDSTSTAAPAFSALPSASTSTAEKKAAPLANKKFIANTASALKRRPMLPRHTSSQTSGTAEHGPKDGISKSSKSSKGSSGSSSNPEAPPTLSAKAAGKRPAKTASEKGTAEQQSKLARVNSELPASRSREASGGAGGLKPLTPRSLARTQSNIEIQQVQPAAGRPAPRRGPTSSGVTPATTSNVAVEGQFDFDPPRDSTDARDIPDRVTTARRSSSTSLFAPTKPSPTPDVPLASKSQLTLLLERDKDRHGLGSQGRTDS